MAIKNRNLEAGAKLISKYKKEEHRAEVIGGEGDKIMYRLDDGREFKSPSGAGTAITGKSCDGWTFWSVETEAQEVESSEGQAGDSEEQEIAEAEAEASTLIGASIQGRLLIGACHSLCLPGSAEHLAYFSSGSDGGSRVAYGRTKRRAIIVPVCWVARL